jgi:hypothetical protein
MPGNTTLTQFDINMNCDIHFLSSLLSSFRLQETCISEWNTADAWLIEAGGQSQLAGDTPFSQHSRGLGSVSRDSG